MTKNVSENRISGEVVQIAEKLYKQNAEYVYGVVHTLIDDQQVAEDLVQEAFFKAFQKYQQLNDKTKFRPWVSAIAINLARTYYKKMKNETPVEKIYEPGCKQMQQPVDIDYFIEKNVVRDALQVLTPKERELVMLKYFFDMDWKDIANYYKITTNNVCVRLHRVRVKLKELLESPRVFEQ